MKKQTNLNPHFKQQFNATNEARYIVDRYRMKQLFISMKHFEYRQNWYHLLFDLAMKLICPTDRKTQKTYQLRLDKLSAYLKREPTIGDLLNEFPEIAANQIGVSILNECLC